MAIVVADGTGLTGANAYIDVAFFKSYHDARGNDYSNSSDTVIEQAIIRATDYIDNRWWDRFRGQKEFPETQALAFPRKNLKDRDGISVEGIPEKLKKATAEYAIRAIAENLAPDPEIDPSGRPVTATSEKVGPIEQSTEFASGAYLRITKPYPGADRLLQDYVSPPGRVIRG